MSHCTTFQLRYADKRLLFRSLRNLGWRPENKVWTEFPSELKKKIGVGGTVIGKLLTASTDEAHLFFTETDEGLVPHIESSYLDGSDLEQYGAELLFYLNEEYVKGAMLQLADQIVHAGGSATVYEEETEEGFLYKIVLGEPGQSVTARIDADGQITEQVEGVGGRSCTELTAPLELLLAGEGARLERTWTHEYDEQIEDRTIQVLRLHT